MPIIYDEQDFELLDESGNPILDEFGILVKNLTEWYPASGQGYVVQPGICFLTDNSGNFLTDNSGNFLTTTINTLTGKSITEWASETKDLTNWYPSSGEGYVLQPGQCFLVDNNGNFLVDNSGNFLVTTANILDDKSLTNWDFSGE